MGMCAGGRASECSVYYAPVPGEGRALGDGDVVGMDDGRVKALPVSRRSTVTQLDGGDVEVKSYPSHTTSPEPYAMAAIGVSERLSIE